MKKSNNKTPIMFRIGLVLLVITMISVQLSSGVFARYSSVATSSDTVSVASFNVEMLYNSVSYDGIRINKNAPAVYMVINEFVVHNSGDVSMNYTLNMRLSQQVSGASYASPVSVNRVSLAAPSLPSGAAINLVTTTTNSNGERFYPIDFADLCGTSYTSGRIYYAHSADGVNYTWRTATKTGDSYETVQLPQCEIKYGGSHYYKVAYFFVVRDEVFEEIPQMTLFYSARCEQID